ncbi:MAG: TonB-dependent receptor [Burkholderiales bacterium]|nr:TonB-dependent receptor [Burkholderiales bacterium]
MDSKIMDMSLEDLMNVTITTVSRKPQNQRDTAAAVFVISQEDIRRSTANSIPELLRMAPGLNVARIDASKWSVTSRGFSGRFSDDLLVMIDGRTVFSPLFAGTFWESLDLPLEDIERIEVVRGPSGTIWGANAANGAIHIITKKSNDTQGTLVSGGGGSEERGFTTLRHGGKIGEDFHYRVFAKGFVRDNSHSQAGAHDSWRMGTLGMRADWYINNQNEVTFQGQYHSGKAGQKTSLVYQTVPGTLVTQTEDVNLAGGHALMRWNRITGKNSNMTLQAYYDHNRRNELSFRERRHTFDIDFQHRFPLTLPFRQEFLWGVGYRWTRDHLNAGLPISFEPTSRIIQTTNIFAQTEIPFIEDHLKVVAGLKFLDNTFAHDNFLPTFRVLWTPNIKQTIWASIIRAVRLPSRFERDGNRFIRNGAEFLRLIGNPDLVAETLWGFETGYKHQLTSNLSVEISGFFNDYNHSISEFETSSETAQLFSQRDTEIFGFEIYGRWDASRRLRFMPSYSHLQIRNQAPLGHEVESGKDPRHQFTLRSQLDITHNIELDAFFRHIDKLPGLNVDSYQTLDLRLAWHPVAGLELSLIGQNLLQSHHLEYMPEIIQTVPAQIQRSLYGRIIWRF